MVAVGVIAIAFAGAAAGIGAFVYFSPAASPTPAPTASPAPISTPAPTTAPAEGKNPFALDSLESHKDKRTYELHIRLADDAAPVDMTKVTAQLIAGDETYPAWDYRHAEHSWSMGSNGDDVLESGEVFNMVIYTPQAGLPLKAPSPVKLILLYDGVQAGP